MSIVNYEHQHRYYMNHREQILQKKRQLYRENIDQRKQYYQDNKDRIKQYYQENKDRIKDYAKAYMEDNKDKIKQKKKEYYSEKIKCPYCDSVLSRSSLYKHKKNHDINKNQ